MALFFATFMLLIFGNVSSADPNMPPPGPGPNDHHGVDCAALPTPEEVAACESANGPNAQHHDPNMPPPGGPCPPNCGPGPNDHHNGPPGGPNHPPGPGGPNDHHGVDCAALPTPEEVTACENGPQSQFHDPNIMPPDLVGVGPGAPVDGPMYGGPNDHHIQAPVDMDGGHDCAAAPTPEEVAACWDAKNQHANQHHVETADPGHHSPGMP